MRTVSKSAHDPGSLSVYITYIYMYTRTQMHFCPSLAGTQTNEKRSTKLACKPRPQALCHGRGWHQELEHRNTSLLECVFGLLWRVWAAGAEAAAAAAVVPIRKPLDVDHQDQTIDIKIGEDVTVVAPAVMNPVPCPTTTSIHACVCTSV